MSFPEETLQEARNIATMYRRRRSDSYSMAYDLYIGKFIELAYGFSEALKKGETGQFLHEARKEVECLSKAGIDFVVARELGLKPRMFWASDMYDLSPGECKEDAFVADHAFITVEAGGETLMIDRFHSEFGKVEFSPTQMRIKHKDFDSDKSTTRHYSGLRELDEEDFIALLKPAAKGHGANILVGGQRYNQGGQRHNIEYDPDTHTLLTADTFSVGFCESVELPHLERVRGLISPLDETAAVQDEGAMLITYFLMGDAWHSSEQMHRHYAANIPIALGEQYLEHLEQAARFHGRKTSLERNTSSDNIKLMERYGFNLRGEIVKENGVDKRAHEALLEELIELVEPMPEGLPEELVLGQGIRTQYFFESWQASPDNLKRGFLYGEEERNAHLEEQLQVIHDMDMQLLTSLQLKRRKTLGFPIENDLNVNAVIKRGHREARYANRIVDLSKLDKLYSQRFADLRLYFNEHKEGYSGPSDDAVYEYHRTAMHSDFADFTLLLPRLRAKQYRKGIQRILSS